MSEISGGGYRLGAGLRRAGHADDAGPGASSTAGWSAAKNVLSTLMHSFFILALISVQWVLWGYSLAFGPTRRRHHRRPELGRPQRRRPGAESRLRRDRPAPGVHGLPDDVRGHHARPDHRRVRRAQALQGVRAVHPAVGDVRLRPARALGVGHAAAGCAMLGALDFAGGTVVHITVRRLGARSRRSCWASAGGLGKEAMDPHDLTMIVLGAGLLWFGWFGFNAGSALARERPGGAGVRRTPTPPPRWRALTWMTVSWAHKRHPSVLGAAAGAVAGLVAITPAAGFVDRDRVDPHRPRRGRRSASSASSCVKQRFGVDDALDVSACTASAAPGARSPRASSPRTAVNAAGADGLLYGNPQPVRHPDRRRGRLLGLLAA